MAKKSIRHANTSPIFISHCVQFIIFEGKNWHAHEDTRTLWKQQLWSCFSLPPAPSLQSLCVSGGGKQRVSWCLCKHLHQHRCSEKTSAATACSHPRRGCTRQIKGREKKQALTVGSTSAAFIRYSDRCPLCISAVGNQVFILRDHSSRQLHQEIFWFRYIMLSALFSLFLFLPLTLPDSHHIFSLVLILFIYTDDYILQSATNTSNSIVMWYIERGPCFIQWV